MSRSTILRTSWEAPQNVTDVTSTSCIFPRVGAIQSGNEVVVAYEQYDVGVDEDIYYAYSSDGGMNWNKHYCLACT